MAQQKKGDRHPASIRDQGWPDERYEYNASGQVLYAGYNMNAGAATTDKSWVVKQVTYTSTLVTRIRTLINVAWDDRTGLFT